MFDPASRFNQALAPEKLTSLAAALNALIRAIDECQRTRTDIERDPAVLLLARHLGSLALENRPAQADLRRACIESAGALERTPLLLTLARRDVSYDAEAKAAFHSEGRKAMKHLAIVLGLQRGQYQVRSNQGGIAVSGEISLDTSELYVQLDLGCMGPGNEVMFRSISGRREGHNNWASISELLDAECFAERLRREIGLTEASDAPVRLLA